MKPYLLAASAFLAADSGMIDCTSASPVTSVNEQSVPAAATEATDLSCPSLPELKKDCLKEGVNLPEFSCSKIAEDTFDQQCVDKFCSDTRDDLSKNLGELRRCLGTFDRYAHCAPSSTQDQREKFVEAKRSAENLILAVLKDVKAHREHPCTQRNAAPLEKETADLLKKNETVERTLTGRIKDIETGEPIILKNPHPYHPSL